MRPYLNYTTRNGNSNSNVNGNINGNSNINVNGNSNCNVNDNVNGNSNGNINGNDKLQFYLASLLYYNRTLNIELLLLY